MATDERKAWFPRKTAGFGWGFPNCWQGWTVIFAYLLLTVCGLYYFEPAIHPKIAWGVFTGLSVLFIFIVWLKGEKSPK